MSDLTDDAHPSPLRQSARHKLPSATTTSALADPSAEFAGTHDTFPAAGSGALAQVRQQDGASIVAGPLLKNNVEALMKSNTPLNAGGAQPAGKRYVNFNICYFSSPEDEARCGAYL
ncbi:hypothetical protein KCP73_15775 [Salmonella enterica subsp. enterica]|nr:hypothetical protein KCP73_15775 [Salmonella enterica subsp. enterica]